MVHEKFEWKKTKDLGLWWRPEMNCFISQPMNISELAKFKGKVVMYAKKNPYFCNGKNGRPNYTFWFCDTKSSYTEVNMSIEENDPRQPYKEGDSYYDEKGQRLFTYDEVQHAINCAAEDGARGYGYGENMVEDYL